jgi:branched-chain amino acid transport system ATP-binding protein
MTAISLRVQNLDVRFGALRALSDVSLTLDGPGTVGLIGPNGAGKTTLLNAVTGFVSTHAGTIDLDGQDLTGASSRTFAHHGVLRSFQTARLLEDETVLTNVLLGAERDRTTGAFRQIVGTPKARRAEHTARAAAHEALARLSLEHLAGRAVGELSSATRRLVELARVLISRPSILLLDEPAAGLDARSRVALADTLRRVNEEQPCLIVLVEHDVSVVRRVCDRTVVLAAGAVLADGRTDDVLNRSDVRRTYFGEHDDQG